MRHLTSRLRAAWCAALLLATSAPAWSQQVVLDPRRGRATRQDLQELLDLFEKSAASPAYSDTLRARSRFQASLIRDRLERGDFQVGDQVLLEVEGESVLNAAFPVTEGPVLRLPSIGGIPLTGVLRSELEPYLRTEVGKTVQDPQLHARSLIRISVMGAVGRPGFYAAPSEALVSDVVMMAGGPSPPARVDDITIERAGRRAWMGDQVRRAIIEGRTLDQLGVRAGDRIMVPQRSGFWSFGGVVQMVSMLLSFSFTIVTLTTVF